MYKLAVNTRRKESGGAEPYYIDYHLEENCIPRRREISSLTAFHKYQSIFFTN
jgi:hypothetical protein